MNLPNKITVSRILLVPIFMIILFLPIPHANLIAALIFVIAAATDGIDGHIARSTNTVTNFGKFLDPLADKLLVTSALIALVGQLKLPSWIAIIIIAREFIVTGLRLIAVNEGKVIAAGMSGKIKTVTQIIATVLLLIDTTILNPSDAFMVNKTISLVSGFAQQPLIAVVGILANVMVYVATFFTIYSCIVYIKQNIEVLKLDDC